MNLRILHIVTPEFGYGFSGYSRFIFSLLRRWDTQGFSLDYFGTDFDFSGNKSPHSQDERQDGAARLWQDSRRLTRLRRALWAFRLWATLLAKRHRYDIAHVHVMTWGGLCTPVVCHLVGKKAVYTITRQGMDDPSTVIHESFGRLKLALYRRYDGILGLAPALVQDCVRHRFQSHLQILPSFMLLQELEGGRDERRRTLAREKFAVPSNGAVILFVGSIIPRKGVETVIDTFIRLAGDDERIRLFLVGPNSTAESAKLDASYVEQQKQKLAQAGFEKRVHWAGLVRNGATLADYYHLADIFVLPTRSEGSPQVFAEAMACELPIVTTFLPGITDASVLDGETGLLIGPEDPDGFVSAVRALLRDPELRRKMGIAARKRMMEQTHFTAYCGTLAAFYRTVALGMTGRDAQ